MNTFISNELVSLISAVKLMIREVAWAKEDTPLLLQSNYCLVADDYEKNHLQVSYDLKLIIIIGAKHRGERSDLFMNYNQVKELMGVCELLQHDQINGIIIVVRQ